MCGPEVTKVEGPNLERTLRMLYDLRKYHADKLAGVDRDIRHYSQLAGMLVYP